MVKIVTDSGSDIPKDWYARYNIEVIPMNVILGGKEYLDGINIGTADIYKYVGDTGKLPKTSAISPMVYHEYFDRYKREGHEAVYIAISSGISASYANAAAAAKEYKGVYAVDSRSLSSGIALLVLYACSLRDAGLKAADIARNVERRAKDVQCSFVVDNLEFLYKGGRCSGVARFASSLLKIKPTIVMADGALSVGKKYMSSLSSALLKYVDDTFIRCPDPDLRHIFITYTTAEQSDVDAIKQRILKKYPFMEVHETLAQATITSHCGKGTLGILYMTKDEKEGLS